MVSVIVLVWVSGPEEALKVNLAKIGRASGREREEALSELMVSVEVLSVNCAAETPWPVELAASKASVPARYLVWMSLLSTSLIATWFAIVTVTGAGVPVLPSVTAAGSVTVMVGVSF